MQPDGPGVAGALVQVVHVLCHQHQAARPAPCISGQRVVASVGLGTAHTFAALGIPVPHTLRVGAKTLLAGQFGRVEARPQAGERVAEGGDAALGAHAGAGEHAQRAGPFASGLQDRARRAQDLHGWVQVPALAAVSEK